MIATDPCTDNTPNSLRLLTQTEIDEHLAELQRMRTAIFGENIVIPYDNVKRHHDLKQDIYTAYATQLPDGRLQIRALFHAFLISHASYKKMRDGLLDERDLPPWKPSDGPAVLWIASCLSLVPRGATRVIDQALGLIAAHPLVKQTDTIAAYANAKGLILARGMGLRESPILYKDSEPFFEFPLSAAGLESLASRTMNVFSCDLRRMYLVES